MHYRCHSLDLSCAGCHYPATHTHRKTFRAGKAGGVDGEPEFAQRGAAAVQPAAILKTRVRVLFRRQVEEEYEEEMRHLADAGSSDGARCCRCVVPGASFLCYPQSYKQLETSRAGEAGGMEGPEFGWVSRSVVERPCSWPPP